MRLNFLHSVSQCSGRKGHIFKQTAWTTRLNPANSSCRSFSLLSSHQNPTVKTSPFMVTRSYNIIIPASSGGKQDGIATDYDPVLPTKEVQAEMDRLISTAYCEAKKIAEIVEKRRNLNSTNPSTSKPIVVKDDRANSSGGKTTSDKRYLSRGALDIQGEVNAAEKLLIMTSHEFFDKALSRQRDQESDGTDDVAVSLHCAFLSVINWLCSTLASLPARQSEEHDDVNFLSKIPAVASATLRSNESILLTYILQLSERSRDLNLPLSIPQFKTIATMIAKHSPGMGGDVSIIILDLSSKVSQVFGEPSSQDKDGSNPIKAEFFSEALKELILRNLLRDAVMLLQGMESIHRIDHVDLQTGMELLNILKKMVDDAMAGSAASSSGFDETDAMELAMILQQPVMAELKHSRKALESYDAMGSLMDSQDQDDDDGDVDDETWDKIMEGDHENDDDEANQLDAEQEQEYDGYTQDMQELNEIIKAMSLPTADIAMKDEAVRIAKSILNKSNSAKAAKRDANDQKDRLITDANMSNHSVDPLAMSARVHLDPATGDVDNIEFVYNPSQVRTGMSNADKTKYKELHQEMINDLVYSRDDAWEIPDIVPQLEKWNGDRSLLFSKDYEKELVKEITEDDEYYDDNLAFDDDDDDEDDEKTTV